MPAIVMISRFIQSRLCSALSAYALIFLFQITPAQQITFTATMPSVITHLQPSDLDVFTNSSSSTNEIFIVDLNNGSNSTAIPNLRLHYRAFLERPNSGSVNSRELVYESYSNEFTLAAFEDPLPMSSKTYFNEIPGQSIYEDRVVFKISQSQLLDIIVSTQHIPDGRVIQEMTLERDGSAIDGPYVETHLILNAKRIQLLSPGNESFTSATIITESNPLFVWSSDLPTNIYGSNPIYELKLYETRGGETPGEAISRPPIYSSQLTISSLRYPAQAQKLQNGVRYFWQVSGYLKGFSNSMMKSEVFAFIYEESANPDVLEIVKILSRICTQEELDKIRNYRSSAEIRIDGEIKNIPNLRSAVDSIAVGNYEKWGVIVK